MNEQIKFTCSCCGAAETPLFVDRKYNIFCQNCFYENHRFCVSCGCDLRNEGTYVFFLAHNGIGNIYCSRCAGKPRCAICGVPLQTGRSKQIEGSVICSDCYMNMRETDTAALKKMTRNVYKFFRSECGFSVRSPRPEVISAEQMCRLTKNANKELAERGFYSFEEKKVRLMFWDRTVSFKCQIYLLHGMDSDWTEEVLAHEAGHDLWQSNFGFNGNLFYKEGFSQYMSFKYNNWCGRPERNIALLTNSDPIYGDGFRAVLSLAEQYSFKGLLRILKSKI